MCLYLYTYYIYIYIYLYIYTHYFSSSWTNIHVLTASSHSSKTRALMKGSVQLWTSWLDTLPDPQWFYLYHLNADELIVVWMTKVSGFQVFSELGGRLTRKQLWRSPVKSVVTKAASLFLCWDTLRIHAMTRLDLLYTADSGGGWSDLPTHLLLHEGTESEVSPRWYGKWIQWIQQFIQLWTCLSLFILWMFSIWRPLSFRGSQHVATHLSMVRVVSQMAWSARKTRQWRRRRIRFGRWRACWKLMFVASKHVMNYCEMSIAILILTKIHDILLLKARTKFEKSDGNSGALQFC